MEGFENYAAVGDLRGVWAVSDSGSIGYLAAARDAVGSSILLDSSDVIWLNLPSTDPGVLGFAFKHDNSMTSRVAIVRIDETGAGSLGHFELHIDTSNRLVLRHASVDRQTSARSLANGVWYYIEIKFLIDDAVGTVEIFVNNSKGGWIDYGPADTRDSGVAGECDQIRFNGYNSGVGGPFYFDDLYFLDLTGSAPGNERLGDCQVETLNPSGAGAEAQWTPDAGSNFQMVDEATPDGDTTFNSSSVVDDDDRFAMDNLVNVPSTVFAVQVNGRFRNENAGNRDVRLKAHDGVTEAVGIDFQPSFSANYTTEYSMFEDHPTDANPWSVAEVNAMEAGYRIQT